MQFMIRFFTAGKAEIPLILGLDYQDIAPGMYLPATYLLR